MVAPERYAPAYTTQNLFTQHFLRQILDADIRFHGTHTASDVDTDSIRDYDSLGRQHATYGHTFPPVSIGHKSEMMVDEGKTADIFDLCTTMIIETLSPVLHDHIVDYCYFHDF